MGGSSVEVNLTDQIHLYVPGLKHLDISPVGSWTGSNASVMRFGKSGRNISLRCGMVSIPFPGTVTKIANVDSDEIDRVSSHQEYEMPFRKGKSMSMPWELHTDSEGWPILPLELEVPLLHLREILRSFLTITYRELLP